jgi:TonB family protein
MKIRLINTIFVCAFLSVNLFAQTPASKDAPVLKDKTRPDAPATHSVGDVRGAVNAKAVYLAKPTFPVEARAAGAEGAVRVEITIDEEGSVIAANAVSGHQLLKAPAEDAARRTKFRITRDANGNAVKTGGVLVYNFAVEKSGWTKIGYDLAALERVRLHPIQIPAIAKAILLEWTEEREMLGKLEEISRREPPTPVSSMAVEPPTMLPNRPNLPVGATANSAMLERRLTLPAPPSAELISLSQNLISALQSRLGSDEKGLWEFNTGVSLGRAFQLYRNPNERVNAASIVRQFAESAPPNVSPEVVSALKNLSTIFETARRTMETEGEIRKSMIIILSGK